MRYSCREDDPGYENWTAARRRVRVLIDGVERNNVITADDDRRMAFVTVLDERGRPRLNADRTGVLTETIHGAVRVETY